MKSRIGVDLQLDRDTVAKLAEAIISHKFGEKRLTSQRPYDVSLKDGKWMINGSFPGPGSGEFWGNGGVFHIVISQKDGQVLECWHTEWKQSSGVKSFRRVARMSFGQKCR